MFYAYSNAAKAHLNVSCFASFFDALGIWGVIKNICSLSRLKTSKVKNNDTLTRNQFYDEFYFSSKAWWDCEPFLFLIGL